MLKVTFRISNIYYIIYFIFLICNSPSIYSQVKMNEFDHVLVPNEYKFEPLITDSYLDDTYIKLEDYLPTGYVTDASQDYTEIIQNVLDDYRNIVFPPFPLLINEGGLTIRSNSNLYFLNNSKLLLEPNDLQRYEVLRLHNVSNVQLFNPFIVGDKDIHKGALGEWGMGISIRGNVNNVKVFNPTILNPWGDGIYIGHLRKISPNGVKIYNAIIDNAYRNGISLTTGINIEFSNVLISNSNFNGFKIEPSNSEATFENIVLNNINTYNNYSSGVAIGGYSKLIGHSDRKLEIKIINPRDNSSNIGMSFGMVSVKEKSSKPVSGYIEIINPDWQGNTEHMFSKRKFYENIPEVILIDLQSSYKSAILSTHKNDRNFITNNAQ